MLIDSHVHLKRSEFKGSWRDVVQRSADAGVTRFLNVGYDLASSAESVGLANIDDRILASVGVHPHDAAEIADETGRLTEAGESALNTLAVLAADPRVVAIGEIGMDYYRDLSPRPAQKTAMILQMRLADRLGLPVIFHVRDAWPEVMALVDESGVPRRGGVLHSFSGDETALRWAVRNGLKLGIGGPVTYKNSGLPEILPACEPADLLLETDAPWLPPVPYRGKRNEPAYLVHTAAKVAEIYGLDIDEVARITSETFESLFGCVAG